MIWGGGNTRFAVEWSAGLRPGANLIEKRRVGDRRSEPLKSQIVNRKS